MCLRVHFEGGLKGISKANPKPFWRPNPFWTHISVAPARADENQARAHRLLEDHGSSRRVGAWMNSKKRRACWLLLNLPIRKPTEDGLQRVDWNSCDFGQQFSISSRPIQQVTFPSSRYLRQTASHSCGHFNLKGSARMCIGGGFMPT